MTCKNCSTEFEGKFCPGCGQKGKTKRITNKAVWEEVRSKLIHYDSGFLFTVWQLARRPGYAIREYLDGKRVMHVKPVKFLLWSTALNFLVFHLLGLDTQMAQALQNGQNGKIGMKFTQYIFEHPAIMIFLMIPNIALCSWLYFRRKGYNYAEHFVLNAYLMGEVSLFGVISNPVVKLMGTANSVFDLKMLALMGIWVLYFGWGYVQFFQPERRKWLTWLKGILVVLSGYILLIIVISLLIALGLFLFGPWLKALLQE